MSQNTSLSDCDEIKVKYEFPIEDYVEYEPQVAVGRTKICMVDEINPDEITIYDTKVFLPVALSLGSLSKSSYDCEKCPRKCISSSVLKNHMTVHTNEAPFKCHQCSKAIYSCTYSTCTPM